MILIEFCLALDLFFLYSLIEKKSLLGLFYILIARKMGQKTKTNKELVITETSNVNSPSFWCEVNLPHLYAASSSMVKL